MPARTRVQQLARESYDRGDPIGWFEQVYSEARGDADAVPWTDQLPNTHLTSWLSKEYSQNVKREPQSAMVVAAGLGDDAEELARAGFHVTAFDISDTAISWSAKRFPNSTVQYVVADLFDPPNAWEKSFDFVFESQTLQALPWKLRKEAVSRIASFVAPGGTLLVATLGRDADEEPGQLPWPLAQSELDGFKDHGLTQVGFLDVEEPGRRRKFVVQYRRMEPSA